MYIYLHRPRLQRITGAFCDWSKFGAAFAQDPIAKRNDAWRAESCLCLQPSYL